jgi:hypothetical protein
MSIGEFARLSRLTGKRNVMYEVNGEVNQDSDGPVEFCWPVPQDRPSSSGSSVTCPCASSS